MSDMGRNCPYTTGPYHYREGFAAPKWCYAVLILVILAAVVLAGVKLW